VSAGSICRLLAAGKLMAHRPVKGRVLIDRLALDSLVQGATTAVRTGRGCHPRRALAEGRHGPLGNSGPPI
jgi:hypothetical protein